MSVNWKFVGILAVFVMLCIAGEWVVIHADASDNMSTVSVKYYVGDYGEPYTGIPPYINQGDTVYLNGTYDISGVVPPYPELAYWDGYDMYERAPSYNISLPQQKIGYYHYYMDPAIYETRLGKWYKYDGTYEKQGWNLAFVVAEPKWDNSTMRYSNGTLVNVTKIHHEEINATLQIEIPPPLPYKHVSDYLIARGDALNITINQSTNVWLFGRIDKLLDHKSTNQSIDVTSQVLSGFEPGHYTVMFQKIKPGNSDFTVRYDLDNNRIQWFDPKSFAIRTQSLDGYSPTVIYEKLTQLTPEMQDSFMSYNLELQEPLIEIASIEEKYNPNQTVDQTGQVHYNTNTSFIEVIGYTNVAPGSQLRFILDEDDQTVRTISDHTSYTEAQGKYGGDMRWFRIYVPINKYGLAAGQHTISAYTALSLKRTNAEFYLYDMPPDSYIPPKTIRYISGRNGPEEFVPTPTPITVTVKVIETKEVIKEVIKEVPPPQESVDSAMWTTALQLIGYFIIGLISIVVGFVTVRFLYRAYKRKRWMQQ